MKNSQIQKIFFTTYGGLIIVKMPPLFWHRYRDRTTVLAFISTAFSRTHRVLLRGANKAEAQKVVPIARVVAAAAGNMTDIRTDAPTATTTHAVIARR